jgi:hypothetical protein
MWQIFFDWYDLVNRSEQWTQACDFAYEAVRRYWDEHGRQTFDNRMRGIEAWQKRYIFIYIYVSKSAVKTGFCFTRHRGAHHPRAGLSPGLRRWRCRAVSVPEGGSAAQLAISHPADMEPGLMEQLGARRWLLRPLALPLLAQAS